MNLSGIIVIVPSHAVEESVQRLNALAGVEVHHVDQTSGKIVVVQERHSVGDEVDGLKSIKALPHVILAELVYHWFEEDTRDYPQMPQDLDKLDGLRHKLVPERLTQ